MKGLEVKEGAPRVDAEILLRRMILPKGGGKIIPETFLALKKLKENGVVTCGLTNNFVPPSPCPVSISRFYAVSLFYDSLQLGLAY